MKGDELKNTIKGLGIRLKDVAEELGMSQQNLQGRLNVKSVKADFYQEIMGAVKRIGKDLSAIQVNGDFGNNTQNVIQDTKNGSDDVDFFKEQIRIKDLQIQSLTSQNSKLIEMIEILRNK